MPPNWGGGPVAPHPPRQAAIRRFFAFAFAGNCKWRKLCGLFPGAVCSAGSAPPMPRPEICGVGKFREKGFNTVAASIVRPEYISEARLAEKQSPEGASVPAGSALVRKLIKARKPARAGNLEPPLRRAYTRIEGISRIRAPRLREVFRGPAGPCLLCAPLSRLWPQASCLCCRSPCPNGICAVCSFRPWRRAPR